jgi:hypothetical protein
MSIYPCPEGLASMLGRAQQVEAFLHTQTGTAEAGGTTHVANALEQGYVPEGRRAAHGWLNSRLDRSEKKTATSGA